MAFDVLRIEYGTIASGHFRPVVIIILDGGVHPPPVLSSGDNKEHVTAIETPLQLLY